jgi:hypothetical protein
MTAGSPKAYFEKDDGHGRVLKVLARDDGRAAVQIKDATGIGMTLGSWIADPTVAPDLCRAIFEAAGQVPPVTIGRLDVTALAAVVQAEFPRADDDDDEERMYALIAGRAAARILADGRFNRRESGHG